MTDGWNEELVSVVTDYRIGWRRAECRQDAIDLLMRSAGGGGGHGAGAHGYYRADAVSAPRLMQPTLTDEEREAVEVAARFMDKWGGVPNTIASDTLRGLLERLT